MKHEESKTSGCELVLARSRCRHWWRQQVPWTRVLAQSTNSAAFVTVPVLSEPAGAAAVMVLQVGLVGGRGATSCGKWRQSTWIGEVSGYLLVETACGQPGSLIQLGLLMFWRTSTFSMLQSGFSEGTSQIWGIWRSLSVSSLISQVHCWCRVSYLPYKWNLSLCTSPGGQQSS